jgi:hypothetical protein
MSYNPHDCFMIDLTQFSSEKEISKFLIDMKLDFNPKELNATNLWQSIKGEFTTGPMTKIWLNRKNLNWFAYQDNEGQKFAVEYLSFLSSMQSIQPGDLSPMDKDNDEIFSDEVTDFNIDSILDKINASGFNSLTKKEVEFLEKRAK